MDWGEPGPGRWITVYANPGHVYMEVGGAALRHQRPRRAARFALAGGAPLSPRVRGPPLAGALARIRAQRVWRSGRAPRRPAGLRSKPRPPCPRSRRGRGRRRAPPLRSRWRAPSWRRGGASPVARSPAGPTSIASTSSAPSACTATIVKAPTSSSRRVSAARGLAPNAGAFARSKPTVRSCPCAMRKGRRHDAGERRGRISSPFETPSTSPNRRSWMPAGESGASASSAPSAHQRRDDDRDPRVGTDRGQPAGERDRRRGDGDSERSAEHQREPGQRGDHEPGEHRVGERLGAVGEPEQHDPAPERARPRGRSAASRRARGW